jgi:hypothetical protein
MPTRDPARKPGHIKSHYVEDPSEYLTGADDEYIEPFKQFLAKHYGMDAARFEDMARVLISRRRDLQGLQDEFGDAGAQGVDDLVAFAKQYKPKKKAGIQSDTLIRPFGMK